MVLYCKLDASNLPLEQSAKIHYCNGHSLLTNTIMILAGDDRSQAVSVNRPFIRRLKAVRGERRCRRPPTQQLPQATQSKQDPLGYTRTYNVQLGLLGSWIHN